MPEIGATQFGAMVMRRLDRAHLVPPGGPGERRSDPVLWATRFGWAAMGLAVAWGLFVAVRPLPNAPLISSAEPPHFARAPLIDSMAQVRPRFASALAAQHIFSAGRIPWPEVPRDAVTAGAWSDAGADAPKERLQGAGPASPGEVAAARTNIELRGVYEGPAGAAAVISFVHSAERPRGKHVRVGEEFRDEKHPSAAWRLETVDVPGASATLSRSGATVTLHMYGDAAPGAAMRAGSPDARDEVKQARAPTVVPATHQQIIARLREAGIEEERIAALLALMNQPEVSQAPIGTQGAAAPGEPRPPPGMEGILRMMAERSAKSGEAKKQTTSATSDNGSNAGAKTAPP